MSKVCEICGKRSKTGNNVSHSNKRTRRVWKPNIQCFSVEIDGVRRKIKICTRCLRSGKVKKAVNRKSLNVEI